MKKCKLFFMLILVGIIFSMLKMHVSAVAEEYALFPAYTMQLNQLAYESASHGNQNAIDISPYGNVFAPFTGKVVYTNTNWGYVLLQSIDKVHWADGTFDYMTVGFMHDSNISDIRVGDIIPQGKEFYQAGGMGDGNPNAYGAHVHITVYQGQVTRSYADGTGNRFAFNAFFIQSSTKFSGRGKGYVYGSNTVSNGAPTNYSNLWVMLDEKIQSPEAQYLSKCTFNPTYCQIETTAATSLKAIPCSNQTQTSEVIDTVSSGVKLTVTGIYKNTVGNYWYRVEKNDTTGTSYSTTGYVFSGDTKVVKWLRDDIKITGVKSPTSLTKGSRFTIEGSISSKYSQLGTVIGVVNDGYNNYAELSGSNRDRGEDTPNSKSYSVKDSKVDYGLEFQLLPTGQYTYYLFVVVPDYYCTDGQTLKQNKGAYPLVKQNFDVVTAGYTNSYAEYLSKCTFNSTYCQLETTAETSLKAIPCSNQTQTSEVIDTVSSGVKLTVTGIYKNTAGNYWYRVEKNDTAGICYNSTAYVFSGHTKVVKWLRDDINITGVKSPTSLTKGSRFTIEGSISSKYSQLGTVIGVVNDGYNNYAELSGSNRDRGEDTPNSKSYSVKDSKVDYGLEFQLLPTGQYTYYLFVVVPDYYCTDGQTLKQNYGSYPLVKQNFDVVEAGHTHSYTDKIIQPTCTEEGYTSHTCSCGSNYVDTYTDPTGHNRTYKPTTAPTISATGTLTGTCSNCSGTTTVTLPKLDTTNYIYTETKAATCTEKGTGRYTWKTTTYGSFYFNVSLSATGHNRTYEVSTAPTTSAAGTLTGTCSKCSGTTTVTLPKLDTTNYTYTETKAATCTANGTGRYTWKTTIYGSFYFDVSLNATDHSYTYKITKDPTATATGTLTGTCSKCSGTTTVTLPKLDTTNYTYTEAKAATCTEKGTGRYTWKTTTYGSFYFDISLSATGHNRTYKPTTTPTISATGTLTGTCSKCSGTTTVTLPKLDTTNYTYTETKAATCTANGTGRYTWKTTVYGSFYFDVSLNATDHSYTYKITKNPTATATGTLTGTCSKCSGTTTVSLPKLDTEHYYVTVIEEPTSTSVGTAKYTLKDATYGTVTVSVTLPKIAQLVLPSALTRIETEAFANVSAETIVIPANVKAIDELAFANCPNLRYLVFQGNPTTIASNILEGCSNVTIRCTSGGYVSRWAAIMGYAVEEQ